MQAIKSETDRAAAARRAQICAIFVDVFELDAAAIVPHAVLKDDLGLDSLDHVDLVLELEKIVGRRIPAEELRTIATVGDVEALLARLATAA